MARDGTPGAKEPAPSANDNAPGASSAAPCPICGKAQVEPYRPFCSKRCADVDLGRWLGGRYALPVREDEDEDGEAPDDPR